MSKIGISPALKFVLLFAAGIIIGNSVIVNFFVLLSLCILCFCIILFYKNKNDILHTVAIFVIIILAGIGKSNFDFNVLYKNNISNLKENYSGCFIHGTVKNIPEYKKDKIRFEFDVSKIIHYADTLDVSGNLIVNIRNKKNTGDTIPAINAGDEILIFGDIIDANGEENPGDFNYKYFLYLNDIDKLFRCDYYSDVKILSNNNLNAFLQYIVLPARKYAINNINSTMAENEAAFLNGLTTGYRSDFSKEMKTDFINAGVMHLIAVSGLNVAYIIIFISLLLTILRIDRKYRYIIIIPLLIFYSIFAGGSASIIRAVIMGSLVLLSPVVQRKINFYNVIALSALVILLWDSRQLFDSGFILSYSAVISLVFFMDKVNKFFEGRLKFIKGKYRIWVINIITVLTSTFLVQLGTFPITLLFFEKISLIGYVSNVIAIPLSNLSLALGFMQIISAPMFSIISSLIAECNFLLLKIQLYFISRLAGLSFSNVEIFGMTKVYAIIYYMILLIIITANRKNIFFRAIICILIVWNFSLFANLDANENTITMLDAGRNGCTHIETSKGSNILIDAGMENYYTHITSSRVIPYLKRRNITTIDLLILNKDISKSFNELYELTKNFRINKIIYFQKEEFPEKLANLLSIYKIDADNIENIKTYQCGDLKMYFINKDNPLEKICIGKFHFLNSYKSDEKHEVKIINTFGDFINSDVYKAPASDIMNTSNIETLLKIKPEYALINLLPKNVTDKILYSGRYRAAGSKLISLDNEGYLKISVKDDGEYKIEK